jgi:mono/diheme cytochrome c family protein
MRRQETLRSSRLLLAIAACLVCLVGLSCAGGPKPGQAGVPPPEMDARALYAHNCAKCHGEDGRAGGLRAKMVGAPGLVDAKWQESVTDQDISETIKFGPKAMPSFEKKLAQPQIDALVGYVRHLGAEANKPAATTP